ncbi:hypothetical protein [Planktothricoides raciborskii]|uniref:hypothetical protein n=1 Tax=Planktothricoides raciborskii TaxID=132608 RepID=UPI001688CB38|nr:hypothetical protein [Planktothricoides raciborskii]
MPASKKPGFSVGANGHSPLLWLGDKDGLKKPGFWASDRTLVATKQETGFLVGANGHSPLLGWVTEIV